MKNICSATFILAMTFAIGSSCLHGHAADGPGYNLDAMTSHPYRFVPAYGHASQNPGSPKWFVPGYGYQIPGFGYAAETKSFSYSSTVPYAFGSATPAHYTDSAWRNWTNNTAGPWYLPGSTTNTQRRTFAW